MNIFKLLIGKLFVTVNGEQVTVNGEPVYVIGRKVTQFTVEERKTEFSMYPTSYTEALK